MTMEESKSRSANLERDINKEKKVGRIAKSKKKRISNVSKYK